MSCASFSTIELRHSLFPPTSLPPLVPASSSATRDSCRGLQTSLSHAPSPCSEQQPDDADMPAEPCISVLTPLQSLSSARRMTVDPSPGVRGLPRVRARPLLLSLARYKPAIFLSAPLPEQPFPAPGLCPWPLCRWERVASSWPSALSRGLPSPRFPHSPIWGRCHGLWKSRLPSLQSARMWPV